MSGPKTKSSYTSKSERRSISKTFSKAVKRDRTYLDKLIMKQKAWAKGQNPWLSVPNVNTAETAKKFIRVRSNTEWGDPRKFVNILGRA
jgi:hypothetical protein